MKPKGLQLLLSDIQQELIRKLGFGSDNELKTFEFIGKLEAFAMATNKPCLLLIFGQWQGTPWNHTNKRKDKRMHLLTILHNWEAETKNN